MGKLDDGLAGGVTDALFLVTELVDGGDGERVDEEADVVVRD